MALTRTERRHRIALRWSSANGALYTSLGRSPRKDEFRSFRAESPIHHSVYLSSPNFPRSGFQLAKTCSREAFTTNGHEFKPTNLTTKTRQHKLRARHCKRFSEAIFYRQSHASTPAKRSEVTPKALFPCPKCRTGALAGREGEHTREPQPQGDRIAIPATARQPIIPVLTSTFSLHTSKSILPPPHLPPKTHQTLDVTTRRLYDEKKRQS